MPDTGGSTDYLAEAPLRPTTAQAATLVDARRVLLATADRRALGVVAAVAADRGLDVRYSSGMDMTVAEAKFRPPDVIVVDLSLGAPNVLSGCRQLSSNTRTSAIPVMLVCKHVTRLFVVEALKAGACDLMVHPIEPDVLTRKLAKSLEGAGKRLPDEPDSGDDANGSAPVRARVNVQHLLDSPTPLHAIPAVVERVIRISGDAQAGARELADAVRMDDRAATLVLRVANSAALGAARRTASLDDAITRIGFKQTRGLVVGNGVVGSFGSETRVAGFDRNACWQHALATAILARQIAEHGTGLSSDAAFIAGLVHDVGRVLLDEFCPEQFDAVVRRAVEGQVPLTVAEREILQTSHAEVGGQALWKWNFPAEIVDAVKYHHDLLDDTSVSSVHRPLWEVVHVADALARATGIGRGGVDAIVAEVAGSVLDNLGLTKGLPPGFWNRFADEFRSAHAFLGVPSGQVPTFTAEGGTGVLWEAETTPVSMLGVALEAAGWSIAPAEAPGVLPAACAGVSPAFVILRGARPEPLASAAAAWQAAVPGVPLVFAVPQGCHAPAGQPSIVEPYDRDALLRLLPAPGLSADAKAS